MSTKIAAANVRLKRAYERPAPADGTRILVDRLWPRGVTKAADAIDQWVKAIAPRTAMRKWFGHDPDRWPEFRRRYAAEARTSVVKGKSGAVRVDIGGHSQLQKQPK